MSRREIIDVCVILAKEYGAIDADQGGSVERFESLCLYTRSGYGSVYVGFKEAEEFDDPVDESLHYLRVSARKWRDFSDGFYSINSVFFESYCLDLSLRLGANGKCQSEEEDEDWGPTPGVFGRTADGWYSKRTLWWKEGSPDLEVVQPFLGYLESHRRAHRVLDEALSVDLSGIPLIHGALLTANITRFPEWDKIPFDAARWQSPDLGEFFRCWRMALTSTNEQALLETLGTPSFTIPGPFEGVGAGEPGPSHIVRVHCFLGVSTNILPLYLVHRDGALSMIAALQPVAR